jgi:hypothetical protein
LEREEKLRGLDEKARLRMEKQLEQERQEREAREERERLEREAREKKAQAKREAREAAEREAALALARLTAEEHARREREAKEAAEREAREREERAAREAKEKAEQELRDRLAREERERKLSEARRVAEELRLKREEEERQRKLLEEMERSNRLLAMQNARARREREEAAEKALADAAKAKRLAEALSREKLSRQVEAEKVRREAEERARIAEPKPKVQPDNERKAREAEAATLAFLAEREARKQRRELALLQAGEKNINSSTKNDNAGERQSSLSYLHPLAVDLASHVTNRPAHDHLSSDPTTTATSCPNRTTLLGPGDSLQSSSAAAGRHASDPETDFTSVDVNANRPANLSHPDLDDNANGTGAIRRSVEVRKGEERAVDLGQELDNHSAHRVNVDVLLGDGNALL